MSQLNGLELELTRLDHFKLEPRARLRVSAIQTGAFISASEQSKFDPTKSFLCQVCQVSDDRVHWHCCPKFASLREELKFTPEVFADLPDCTKYHLLVPKLPESLRLMTYLENMPDRTLDYDTFEIGAGGMQHLFTDGACRRIGTHTFLAAWSVQNATSRMLVAAAPLHGGKQTAHRAELQALCSAVAWGNQVNMPICLWSDSANNVDTLDRLIQGELLRLPEKELDLWTFIEAALDRRRHLATQARWIPSHLCPSELEDEYEVWISHWNDRADYAAVHTNMNRDPLCLQLAKDKASQYDFFGARLKQLRDFYLAVADTNDTGPSGHRTSDAPVVRTVDEELLTEHLPIGWMAMITGMQLPYTSAFARSLVEQFIEWESQDWCPFWVSDVEMIFVLAGLGFAFPIDTPAGRRLTPFFDLFAKPPITQLLKPLGSTLDVVLGGLGLQGWRRSDFSVLEIGIHKKGGATFVGLPEELATSARKAVRQFTRRRPFRNVQDFSRPLPAL